jgi:hypothetical protein
VQQSRPIEQDGKRAGGWLVLVSVVAAVALRRALAGTLVAAPLVAAAAVELRDL